LANWVRTDERICVVAQTVILPPGSTEAIQAWVSRKLCWVAGKCEGVFKNLIRFGEAFLDVAAVEPEVRAEIRSFDGLQLGEIGETEVGNLTNRAPTSRQVL
jgi:hypothetical protein